MFAFRQCYILDNVFRRAVFSKTLRSNHLILKQNISITWNSYIIDKHILPSFSELKFFTRQLSNKPSADDLMKHDSELQNFLEEIKQDFSGKSNEEKSEETEKENNLQDTVGTDSISNDNENQKLPISIEEKFKQYRDEDASVILSAEEQEKPIEHLTWKQKIITVEEDREFFLYREKPKILEEKSLERGQTGVFDLKELTDILREENLYDIAVIEIPLSFHYCDHMVLSTAKSTRHLTAVTNFIRKLYKNKKLKTDPYVKIEGEDSPDWKVIDMGNIVLHVFLPESREFYDIESLWTVGEKYDTLYNQKIDSYEDLLQTYMSFLNQSNTLSEDK